MKNRFCRKGMMLLWATCLLSAVGMMNSCSDDYDLDETMPTDLKGSIYDELKAATDANGKPAYSMTVRLIDDLDYAEVLSKTGSKTLFVAPDSAYETFFKNNALRSIDDPWHTATSYQNLSIAQKKCLLYGSMLNNAYVMEMMAHVQSSGTLGQDSYVAGTNLCMRQSSAATVTDSIPYMKWYNLPVNYNASTDEDSEDYVTRCWEWHNKQANKEGIYLVCDNTVPMMTHFLEGNMKYRDITNEDVAFILGVKKYGNENRSYIYNARVIQQDVTCMNGYYNVLDRVLLAPSNMAEVIRTNGKTNLFSHIMDRFSVPVYNQSLTDNAQTLYANITDSVFVKRYFSVRGQSANFATDHLGNAINASKLSYDPAWNHYQSPSVGAEQDMAAMFVPCDSALRAYFTNGAGRSLIETYGTPGQTLEYNLDQVPVKIMRSLVNNLMKPSFYETVPHKYLTIMNDARDQMFNLEDFPTEDAYRAQIDRCELANNGVVYIMKYVPAPADFSAVIAPAINSTNTRVVREVLQADEDYVQGSDFNNAPLQKYFSTYLKAMQSSFSFFVPTDDGLKNYGYVDPASVVFGNEFVFANPSKTSQDMYYWSWDYKPAKNGGFPIAANAYKYKPNQGQPGVLSNDAKLSDKASQGGAQLSSSHGAVKRALLIDMINQHIVVHDNNDDKGVLGASRKYFLSREGAPVYVKSGNEYHGTSTDGKGMVVLGGWQCQLAEDTVPENDHECVVTESFDQSKTTNGYGNGHTYFLDRPMQPAIQSVYYSLKTHPQFSKFLQLCSDADDYENVLDSIGLRENLDSAAVKAHKNTLTDAEWRAARNLYKVFVNGNTHSNDKLVRFFNNYQYTIYAPNNDAIDAAIANGLPTWQTIKEEFEACKEKVDTVDSKGKPKTIYVINDENKARLQAMVTLLVNFLKYHFQDQSLFVDNLSRNGEYQSQSVDEKTNVYIPLTVSQTPGDIAVKDMNGATVNVLKTNNYYNVMVRDAVYNNAIGASTDGIFVQTSSYAVIHEIGNVLNFYKLPSEGKYSAAWKTPSTAKKFVKKYIIKK